MQSTSRAVKGDDLQKFYLKNFPIAINWEHFDTPPEARNSQAEKQYTIEFTDRFMRRWIPKIYGISPESPIYREACIHELLRHLYHHANINYRTIAKGWFWEGDAINYSRIPGYLPAILVQVDTFYRVLEHIEALPRIQLSTKRI